jgi:hypothetical protein
MYSRSSTIFLFALLLAGSVISEPNKCRKASANVSGVIRDGTNNNPLTRDQLNNSGASVVYENIATGTRYPATFQDAGVYTVSLPVGEYNRIVTIPGFAPITSRFSVTAPGDFVDRANDIMISPSLRGLRVILTWNGLERDLDSHTGTPNGQHISYSNRNGNGIIQDYDKTDAYGPETTTVTNVENGWYKFYVYNYSGAVPIANTQAKVVFYKDDTVLGQWDIPTQPAAATHRYWNVFQYNTQNGELQSINQLSTAPLF